MAFTISGGRIDGLYKPTAAPFGGVRLSDQVTLQYAEIWARQPQVRTVVGFLARNIAQIGLHLYKRVSDTDRERVIDHPLSQMLATPNRYTTTYRFVEAIVSDLAIYDNALLLKVKLDDAPYGLVRIDPTKVDRGR